MNKDFSWLKKVVLIVLLAAAILLVLARVTAVPKQEPKLTAEAFPQQEENAVAVMKYVPKIMTAMPEACQPTEKAGPVVVSETVVRPEDMMMAEPRPLTLSVTTRDAENEVPVETLPEADAPIFETPEQETELEPLPVNEAELEMLACVIYQEAGSDYISDETRYMVGDVVLNRIASDLFPDTMDGVLTQRAQYGEYYWTGIRWLAKSSDPGEAGAVQRAYDTAYDLLSGARHSELYGLGYVFQAEFVQGSEVIYSDGIYFGR